MALTQDGGWGVAPLLCTGTIADRARRDGGKPRITRGIAPRDIQHRCSVRNRELAAKIDCLCISIVSRLSYKGTRINSISVVLRKVAKVTSNNAGLCLQLCSPLRPFLNKAVSSSSLIPFLSTQAAPMTQPLPTRAPGSTMLWSGKR